jgi:hypothetical protein
LYIGISISPVICDRGTEKQLKLNAIGQLTIKNYTFERVENFK